MRGAVTVRRLLRALPVYLALAAMGALLVSLQRPLAEVPGVFGIPAWIVHWAIGVVAGLVIAGLLHATTAAVTRRVAEGRGVAFLNGGLMALMGALLGLVGYFVLELLFTPSLWLALLEAGLVFFLTFLGFQVGYREDNLLASLAGGMPALTPNDPSLAIKVLDTSVIIDGRIEDLVGTGFVEGQLVIPQFVLEELQQIADSADNLRRRKGRRGLDVLHELRNNPKLDVQVVETDFPEINAVDRKLIQLAKELDADLLTTDFNLNKVAQVEDIDVLNINKLANAVKPRFIPGEELEVDVIDRGEEIGQGVGYLDDGTMVVIENGRRFIGKTIRATVSSSLQTDAGKMLFVRPKGEVNGGWAESSST